MSKISTGCVGESLRSQYLILDENRLTGIMKAKVTLIEDIGRINGNAHSLAEFDRLYDLDIDLLHQEVTKAQDKMYFKK